MVHTTRWKGAACVLALLTPACSTLPGTQPDFVPDGGVVDVVLPRDVFADRTRSVDEQLGPTVSQPVAPPPIAGGTLLVTRDGRTAVASDPDHDTVHLVDLVANTARALPLEAGDEPGRAVEDGDGRVHVLLRRGGAVVTVDGARGAMTNRRAVCPAPRGIAWDAASRSLVVACMDGDLVWLPATDGAETRRVRLVDDLRDVVINAGTIFVSRFRSAQVLLVSPTGELQRTVRLPDVQPSTRAPMASAEVAWRMVSATRGVTVLHQRATSGTLQVTVGGYGPSGACRHGAVHAAITHVEADGTVTTSAPFSNVVLGVDLAPTPDAYTYAVAAPGNNNGLQVLVMHLVAAAPSSVMCTDGVALPTTGQVTAVTYDAQRRVVYQTREPYTLVRTDLDGAAQVIPLEGPSRADTGHRVFHIATASLMACASCHPEGNDDGHTWTFDRIGPRRTQSLRGGIGATAPFHWDGDMRDASHLMTAVFGERMAGGTLAPSRNTALFGWMDRLPALAAPGTANSAAIERGRAIFHDPQVGCATCHTGDMGTNNNTVDVGTGGTFQVPVLRGLAWRAPYMHNGCAPTLRARFVDTACGGGEAHGHTRELTDAQLDDLIAYLVTR